MNQTASLEQRLTASEGTMTSFRQTPPCLLEGGVVHPELKTETQSRTWATAEDGRVDVRRSALGLDTAQKTLFYAMAEWSTPKNLADALLAAGVASAMAQSVDLWLICSLAGPRGAAAEQLVQAVRSAQPHALVRLCESPADAYRQAQELAKDDDRIVAFGSFYTVSGVMQARLSG